MGWKLVIGLLLVAMTTFAEEIKTIGQGAFGAIDQPLQTVVTNKTQWAELWAKHTANKLPKPELPEIDFNKNSVVLVSAGRKTTGGYTIEITNVRRSKEKTEIVVTAKGPKEGALTIQALTAPFHIVEVARIEGPFTFIKP
jgi:hypothetical protein